MEAELDLGVPAPPRQVAHGPAMASDPDVAVLGAVEHFLAGEGSLGNCFLHARAHGAGDHAAGPHILERGCRLDAGEVEALHEPRASARGHHLGAEGAEALREPHRPQPGAGEAARGMVQESPLWR